MVLVPHGGPWARDEWGFNSMAQWLANRGYAVLQPNFRGSTGYGKKHLNAGNKQWGLKMHDDLIDAVNWAVGQGIADANRVGIMGGSYGGYCALAAVTYTPKVFACSVDIVGPSNLKTLIGTIPPYWKPIRSMFDVRMGNVDDPNEAELIKRASPLNFADRIVRPLLIGQGANDPRVKQAESEQIVAAIAKNGGSVTYVVYPDEGHGFARPENRTDFNARAEVFLATYLGGRVEPMTGDRIPGSTAVVRVVGKHSPTAQASPKSATTFRGNKPPIATQLQGTMKCPRCDQPIDETDTTCPHCSAPIKRPGFWQKLLAIFSSPGGKSTLRVTKTVTVKKLNVVTNTGGERHQYHSLEELSPELRTTVQDALSGAASGTALKTYKVRDASGNEHTYHSLEEMPPQLRSLLERAQDKSKQ
jgi:dienelactone hydrolase